MWWNFAYHLAMIPVAISTYYFWGLIASSFAMIGMVSALILFTKARREKVEPIYLVELGLLMAFALPAYFLDKGILLKLHETISGLIMGVGVLTWSYFSTTPIMKSFIPNGITEFLADPNRHWVFKKMNHYLVNTPEPTWKKIDYLWGVEMTLSAGLSLAIALLFPTNIWFYAKNIIGPVLTVCTFSIQTFLMHQAVKQVPILANQDDTQTLLAPEAEATVIRHSPATSVLYKNYRGKNRKIDEAEIEDDRADDTIKLEYAI